MKKQVNHKSTKEITGGIFSDTKFLVQTENIVPPLKIPDRLKNLKIPLPIKTANMLINMTKTKKKKTKERLIVHYITKLNKSIKAIPEELVNVIFQFQINQNN